MPMRLRAARASAMIRVLPSSNSLIFMGLLPRNFTCGILCASSPHPHGYGCLTSVLRPRVPRHCFERRIFDAAKPEQGGSARGTAFDLDHELDAHLESVLVPQIDSEIAPIEGGRG